MRVACIDDEPLILGLQRAVLQMAGFEVVAAIRDSTSAIELLRHVPFDVAVVDFCMPGCSGLELAPRIRQLGKPVILCSTAVTPEVERMAPAAGISSVVRKTDMVRSLAPAVRAAATERG